MKKSPNEPLIVVGRDALDQFQVYCRDHDYNDFALIADQNTYPVLGQRVQQMLETNGWTVTAIILEGDPVLPGDIAIFQVFDQLPARPLVCVSVGSGSLTDITRFVSYHSRNRFIALPTAPSVDGFTSTGSPLISRGFKKTHYTHAPEAIFIDLETLQNAPTELIASGLGDMLGKFIAQADWKMGSLLWGEAYDPEIAENTWEALQLCVAQAGTLCDRDEESIRLLMQGLIESGLSMLRMNLSHPASGAEHHISHFLEMHSLQTGGPHLMHGETVALGSIPAAKMYTRFRAMSKDEAAAILAQAQLPTPEDEVRAIRAAYGPLADDTVEQVREQIYMGDERFEQLKRDVLDHWDTLQKYAARVALPEQLESWLAQVCGPTTPEEIGVSAAEMNEAVQNAHYLRSRFTIAKLFHYMGILPEF